MTEQRRKTVIICAAAAFAVALAYIFRIMGRGSFYPTLFSYLRSFIYIGLYAAWGLSVRQKIVQRQVKVYLTGVSVLLVLWMTLRTAKYFIFWQPTAVRYFWYMFYLPMLFVPMLAVLIAMSLGKPNNYRLPKSTLALWIVSGVMFTLVMTNDLHQFVFTFPDGAAVWTDKEHGYAFLYYPIIGWQIICAVAALVIMLFNCRIPSGKRRLWPAMPMALSVLYCALYYLGVPWLRKAFGDITAFQSLMYVLTFEACIACGYIHSNSRYAELFALSVGTSAEITDGDFNVRYKALNTKPISKEDMKRAKEHPFSLGGGLLLHTMPVSGGYAVWTEDASALLEMKDELKSLSEELKERNDLLRYEYKREAKRRVVEEQNRLYDLLQSATQRQIDSIAKLTKEYQRVSESDPERAKILLTEIAVLCSYIKRRKHLTLLTDRDYKVSANELERAFSESLQTLKLLSVSGTLYVESGLPMLSGRTAAAVFDFYEEVIEADLENLKSIQVSFGDADGLRLSLNVRCTKNLSAMAAQRPNMRYESDDDEEYQHLVFFPEGGAAI